MSESLNDGYYDPAPRALLDKPVALVGHLSDEVRVVGYRLAALWGLPAASLDRTIEHRAGKSIQHLLLSESESSYRRHERVELARLLRDRPAGVLTLGDGTLLDPDNRALLERDSHLVALELDLVTLYWKVSGDGEPSRGRNASDFQPVWTPQHTEPPRGFEQVRPFWQPRQEAFQAAPHRIDVSGLDRAGTVRALEELLSGWVEGQPAPFQ